MSIKKSEKFVAVTTTYVQNAGPERGCRSPLNGISLIAIRGLAREPYTVVHELAGWTTGRAAVGPGSGCGGVLAAIVRRSPDYREADLRRSRASGLQPVSGSSRRLERVADPFDPRLTRRKVMHHEHVEADG